MDNRMDNYRNADAGQGHGGMLKPDVAETRRLRNQLMEYDGYLQEMRKSNMKNVETLDVIQRYTDKSASGIQKLTEEGAAGMQKLAEESLSGIQMLARECTASLRKYASAGEEALNRTAEAGGEHLLSLTDTGLGKLKEVADEGRSEIETLTAESLSGIRALAEESFSRIQEVNNRNVETAQRVDEIRELVAGQTESLRKMQQATDDFTHKENVKVYRNVQAVVVEEVKKQTDELKDELKASGKGIRPLLIITLLLASANVILLLLQILGIFVI